MNTIKISRKLFWGGSVETTTETTTETTKGNKLKLARTFTYHEPWGGEGGGVSGGEGGGVGGSGTRRCKI